MFAVLSLAAWGASAQAPIQERSAPASSIEGARLAATAASNATGNAAARLRKAALRLEVATEQHKETRAEVEAARKEHAAALHSLEDARQAEAGANTALDSALKK